jgi:addiction module HigA family antidote
MRHPTLRPAHPGELLREIVVPATGRSKTEIARMLGISRQTLYDILAEKQPVTAAMALRLGKLFGDGPGVWLRMQGEHDLWRAARDLDLAAIPTIKAA